MLLLVLPIILQLSPWHLIKYPTIDRNQLSIDIHVLAQEDHRLCHLLITPWPIRGYMPFLLDIFHRHMGLIALIALVHGHLAWEVARSDAIHPDLRLLKFCRHELAEVYRGSFRGIVSEVTLAVPHYTAHA